MDRRAIFIIVVVVLAVMALPTLGLLIFFSNDIVVALFGPRQLSSGVRLSYKLTPDESGTLPDVETLKATVLKRVDPDDRFGVEVAVDEADGLLVVSVPEKVVEETKRLLARPGRLEFRIVADRTRDRQTDFDGLIKAKQAGKADDPAWRWLRFKNGWEYYVGANTSGANVLNAWGFVYVVDQASKAVEVLVVMDDGQDVTGRDLARVVPSVQDGQPIVWFQMRPEAEQRFSQLTKAENVGRHLAIILDGEIQTAPVLQSTLSSNGIITGYKDRHEVDEVVKILNSGELGVRLGEPVREEPFGRP